MKKIILNVLLIFVLTGIAASQTVDPPSGYTSNYRFRKYNEGAHASADSVNANLNDIDLAIKNVDKSKDSLKTRFNVLHNSSGTIKSDVVYPSNTVPGFFEQYFVRYFNGDDYVWKLRVDQTMFDNDTLKIRPGVIGKLDSTQTWNGTNSFHNEVTKFGNGTSAVINYQIANDIGSIEWQKNGSTILKWDENDGTYFQFLSHIDITGDISLTGYFKPASHSDGSAPINSIYYSTTQSVLVYKDSGGTARPLY